MKQIIQNTIVTFLIAGSALPALAQTNGRLIKNITSGAFLAPKAPPLSSNISAAVQRAAVEAQFSTVLNLPTTAAPRLAPALEEWEHPTWHVYRPQQEKVRTRSWLEQQKRNIKARQLKREHAKQIALRAQLAALPKLQPERAFRAADLKDYLITNLPAGSVPQLPLIEHPDYVYRGLGLNSNRDIYNILTNGLLLKDVGNFSNGLLLTLAASPFDAAAISTTKYTNLTRTPSIALHYALRNSQGFEDRVAVIVSIRGEERRGPIIQVQHDIPATRISMLIVLLNVEGVPTWCRIQLQEGEFVITPYENKNQPPA